MRGLFAVTKETFVGNGSGSLGGKDGHRGALSREAHRMESGRDSNILRYGFTLQRESIRGHLMGVDKPGRLSTGPLSSFSATCWFRDLQGWAGFVLTPLLGVC